MRVVKPAALVQLSVRRADEIRAGIHQALLTLGCAIICWRRLKNSADPSPQSEPPTSA